MKKVFASTDMVIHVWAQRSQQEGHNGTRSVFFEDQDNLYSYGYHFALATFHNNLCIINDDRYSVTTSSQQASVRQSTRQYQQVFTTTEILHHIIKWRGDYQHNTFTTFLKELCEKEANNILERTCYSIVKRKKLNLIEEDISHAQHLIAQLGIIMTTFNIIMDNAIIDKLHALADKRNTLLIAYKEQIAADNKAKKERDKVRKEQEEKTTQEALNEWLQGNNIPWGSEGLIYRLETIYMRIKGDMIQTTQRAEFPISDAIKVFPIIKKLKESKVAWYDANHERPYKLGHFSIDAIEENGNVRAGCHYVAYPQIETIAKQLNILA